MSNTTELLEIVHIDEMPFACNQIEICPYKERTLSYAIGVTIPTVGENPDEVFKECCYNHFVFADLDGNESFKNDYSSFYHQRQLSTETATYKLIHLESGDEFDLNDSTFGTFFPFGIFPTSQNLNGYLIQWKKVLTEIGDGNFKIIKTSLIAGITTEFPSMTFTLRQFSTKIANNTVRMDVVMNGRLEKSGVNFTGTAWKHSIRVPGFFGRREAQFEEDNIVSRSFEKRQISMKQTNEFKYQTNLIPDCLTNEILDFMIFGNDIFMNDYNLNNHSYNFVKFGVKFASNDGTVYKTTTRKAQLNLVFNDKFENNLKRNFN